MPRHGGTFHVILDSFPEVLMGWFYYCFLYTLNAHNFFLCHLFCDSAWS